jgi:hypothetical protein
LPLQRSIQSCCTKEKDINTSDHYSEIKKTTAAAKIDPILNSCIKSNSCLDELVPEIPIQSYRNTNNRFNKKCAEVDYMYWKVYTCTDARDPQNPDESRGKI